MSDSKKAQPSLTTDFDRVVLRRSLWRHVKTGNRYRVCGTAFMQASTVGAELDMAVVVLYEPEMSPPGNTPCWVREINEFLDRFERVDLSPAAGDAALVAAPQPCREAVE